MPTLTLDLETYFDAEFSLKKLPTLIYIRDPRFLVHGAAVKLDDAPAQWIERAALPHYLHTIDWAQTTLITHHANFDNTVLYEHYGRRPAQRIDTLALCRMLLPHDLDFDLDSIAPLLGLPGKVGGGQVLAKIKGVRELSAALSAELAEYALGDVESTYALYRALWPLVPEAERETLDLIIRMSTEGRLELDAQMLKEAEREILEDRAAKLDVCSVTPEQLRSRNQFAELLRARGVEPPIKISKTTGKPTWAFSKQDPEFVALQVNPKARSLIAARMAWASNNALSRIKHFKVIAAHAPHTLPMQLNASGAHSHRLSGGGQINTQNLNRGSKLRLSIIAPKGYVIVVVDSSQIELRLNAWISDHRALVERLRRGEDPYLAEATQHFAVPAERISTDQRHYIKVVVLGAGYGMGPPTFRIFCATGPFGMAPIYLSELDADRTIHTYRANNRPIKDNWDWLQSDALPVIAANNRSGREIKRKGFTFRRGEIELPSGLSIKYPDLECSEQGWTWGMNGRVHYLHGGIVANNTTQGLAGDIIRRQMSEIDRALDGAGHVVHQVHDEILTLCRERDADDVLALMQRVMSTPPPYAPDLPLACKGGYDQRYSK